MKEKTDEARFRGVEVKKETVREWLKRDLDSVLVLVSVLRRDDAILDSLADHFMQQYMRDKANEIKVDVEVEDND